MADELTRLVEESRRRGVEDRERRWMEKGDVGTRRGKGGTGGRRGWEPASESTDAEGEVSWQVEGEGKRSREEREVCESGYSRREVRKGWGVAGGNSRRLRQRGWHEEGNQAEESTTGGRGKKSAEMVVERYDGR